MKNIKMTIAYDGGLYLGWQKTKEGASIEETLQKVLEQIFQTTIELQAASRTDAGVHAEGQVVNFVIDKSQVNLKRLPISLNSLLPSSIAVLNAEQVPIEFHPTLDVQQKEYHYWICFGSAQLPRHRCFSWHYPHPLEIEKMDEAARFFIGAHDFKAFCNELKNSCYENYVREIHSLEIIPHPDKRLQFIIRGKNFLYKMVRNIVGTLVYVGRKKINPNEILALIKRQDRTKIGPTVPAHGLTLFKVIY